MAIATAKQLKQTENHINCPQKSCPCRDNAHLPPEPQHGDERREQQVPLPRPPQPQRGDRGGPGPGEDQSEHVIGSRDHNLVSDWQVTRSSLNMVDLAGSERLEKTEMEAKSTTAAYEGLSTNWDLFHFGRTIGTILLIPIKKIKNITKRTIPKDSFNRKYKS